MATKRMYERAFEYRNAKLWKRLYDDDLFAVKLSDGEVGFCSVMGMMGEHVALGLYVGESGYQGYQFIRSFEFDPDDEAARLTLLTSQDCLQCSFEYKEALSDRELAEVRRYAKENEISLRGKNAYPQFTKYRPGRYPWEYDSKLDENRICEALAAAVALSEMLDLRDQEDIGLYPLTDDTREVPMLVCENNAWSVTSAELPPAQMQYPAPTLENEVMAARLKRAKKRGVWECGTARMPTPVQEDGHEDEAPYFPLLIAAVNLDTGMVQRPILSDGDDADELLGEFVQMLLAADAVPRTIYCGDDRSFALIKDLCAKTGIRSERTDEMDALYDVIDQLIDESEEDDYDDDFDPDEETEELIEALSMLPDSELRTMPREMANMLLSLAEADILPEDLTKRIKRVFKKK